jgi:hypothetical protein
MGNLSIDFIAAYENGTLLKAINEEVGNDWENTEAIAKELAKFHNEGRIDIISVFSDLKNDPNSEISFFDTRDVLEKAMIHIEAPIQKVMDLVLKLLVEAGQDFCATTIVNSYVEFCVIDSSRPEEALNLIENSVDRYSSLLLSTLVAGSKFDPEHYLKEGIRLSQHESWIIRCNAIFSLGVISDPESAESVESAISCLERSSAEETNDQVLGKLIASAFNLYKLRNEMKERLFRLIDNALSRGKDYSLHAATEIFGFSFSSIPDNLLGILLKNFLRVNPENEASIRYIDFGLKHLLKQDSSKGIDFLSNLLRINSDNLSIKAFGVTINELLKREKVILNSIITRWLQTGEICLCRAVNKIVSSVHGHDLKLKIIESELNPNDSNEIKFISRKAIGFLFYIPIAAASVIVSLMDYTDGNETEDYLLSLLYDPLLISYPGQVKDYLLEVVNLQPDEAKIPLKKILDKLDDYLRDFESTGEIPELYPSQSQREARHRRQNRQASELYREAEKRSVLFSLIPKSTILYGKRSIIYQYQTDGTTKRMETPLQSIETGVEIAQLGIFDPFYLDILLTSFRFEKKNEINY